MNKKQPASGIKGPGKAAGKQSASSVQSSTIVPQSSLSLTPEGSAIQIYFYPLLPFLQK